MCPQIHYIGGAPFFHLKQFHTIHVTLSYDRLAELVQKKIEKTANVGTTNEVSFITFNYDTCLEFALVRNNLGVDYGLSEPFLNDDEKNFHFNVRVKVPVLKLHGSINWAMCPKCKVIVPTEVDPYRRTSFVDLSFYNDLRLTYGTNITRKSHSCGVTLEPLPFIVPPTWNKSSSSAPGLQDVWKRAAKELGNAENIIVIGYSLPPTDMFFKYLFALGINSDAHLEKFIVINGPNGESTRSQFEGLLGPMTEDSFQFYPFLFSGAIHIIEEALNQ